MEELTIEATFEELVNRVRAYAISRGWGVLTTSDPMYPGTLSKALRYIEVNAGGEWGKLAIRQKDALYIVLLLQDESFAVHELIAFIRRQWPERPPRDKRGRNAGTEAKVREAHMRLKQGEPWKSVLDICAHETYVRWCKIVTGEDPITKY